LILHVAGPMLLIGLGNGAALGPLTVSGVTRVASEDAGAASGLVNVSHQLGGTVGLSALVVVFASSGSTTRGVRESFTVLIAASGCTTLGVRERLADQISAAVTGSTVMLAAAFLVTLMMVMRPHRRGPDQS